MRSLSSNSYDLLFGRGGFTSGTPLRKCASDTIIVPRRGAEQRPPTRSCFSLALTPPPASQPAPALPEGTPPNPASPRRPVSTLDHRTAS